MTRDQSVLVVVLGLWAWLELSKYRRMCGKT